MDNNTNSNHCLASLPKEVLPFSEKPFVNRTGFQVPGLTSEAQKLTLELLQKNHDKFDIFFDPSRGFHSHFAHHILAVYALGGSQDLLNKIYETHASYQRPKSASKVTITRDNWTEHLGKIDLWNDFLEFFDKVIEEEGVEKVLNNYAFHPKLFPRLFAGFFHPIIHLGYGIEFQIPIIVSEGLAQAAIHQNTFENLMDEDYLSFKGAAEKKKSAMEIIKEASKDNRFDVIVKETNGKIRKLMAERVDAVKEYSKHWVVSETEEGIRNAIHDLYETCVLAYGTTGIRPDQEKIVLDFFLMHGLTSILLVSAILPYVSVDKRLRLLRAHFAGLLSEYIARGRPELHFDLVKHYNEEKKPSNEPNPWADILKDSFEEVEDAHLIKVIRALMKAEQEWTPNEKDNVYFKTAQVTCDGFKALGWGEDIGFEGNWKGRGIAGTKPSQHVSH